MFVPRGDPYVTRHCKSRSKDAASTVYIVYVCQFSLSLSLLHELALTSLSLQDKKERDKLGIRVHKDIYKDVTKAAQQTAENRAAAVQARDVRDQRKARLVLNETFPNMSPNMASTRTMSLSNC